MNGYHLMGGAVATDDCGDVSWSNDFEAVSDDCGATGSVTVTFTASDECGNTTSSTATFTIEDTTAPELSDAMDMTVECDGSGNSSDLESWLSNNGGSEASELCGMVSWSNDFEALSDDCGATGSATVTFTAIDECGNSASTSATFTIEDTQAPVLEEEAKDQTVECDGSGNGKQFELWLTTNGGAIAIDACSETIWNKPQITTEEGCGNSITYNVTFPYQDECGNSGSTSAVFTIEDTTAPSIDVEAMDMTVECDGSGNGKQLELWLTTFGGAEASDICSDYSWDKPQISTEEGCGGSIVYNVTFGVTDDCGNSNSTSAVFTIEDTTPPSLTDAMNMTVECDGQGNVSDLENWIANYGGATANDICSDITWSNDFEGLSDDCGATGSATVTFTVTDDCGNSSSTTATFTIEDTTAPEVTDAMDMTVECDGEGNISDLEAWLANNGGATASDLCGDVTWTNSCVESGTVSANWRWF